jgi:deoxyribonuclease-4
MEWYYGCHLSGIDINKSIDEVNRYKGNLIQIFVSNPIGKHPNNILDKYDKISKDIKNYSTEKLTKIVIHSPYTLNFAKQFNIKSYWIKTILDELRIAHKIGAIGCVIHVGKYLDLDVNLATQNMYLSLKYIVSVIRSEKLKVSLILETAAGQGTELFVTESNTIDDLANFYHRFNKEDKKILKICVDTCHIFSGGFDISSKKKVRYFFILFDKIIGLEHLALIHFNDSKTEYNSHKDRHEKIGKGKIKISGLIEFIRQAYKFKIPLILETHEDAYKKEIPWINKIINKLK